MAKVLGRSKSMRLRTSPKETQAEFAPVPSIDDMRSFSTKSRADSAVTMTRPRTSSGGKEKKSAHPKHVPIVINSSTGEFDFRQPSPEPNVYNPETSGDLIIGMALGSPTQAATPVFQPSPVVRIPSDMGVTTTVNSSAAERENSQPKPKVSRWKSIFGRKPVEATSPQPFYQAQPSSFPRQLGSEVDVHSAFKSPSPGPSPIPSEMEGDRKRKGRVAVKLPVAEKNSSPPSKQTLLTIDSTRSMNATAQQPKGSPLPPPKDIQIPRVTVSNDSGTTSPATPPHLDIDIPKSEMERYSVMFGSLLGGPNSRNSTNLLARRQGNFDKLTPLDERALNANNVQHKIQRRATSPTVKKSPLSLFPNDSKQSLHQMSTVNRPRPIQRSKTLPMGASPVRGSFDQSDDAYSEAPSTAGLSTWGPEDILPSVSPNYTFDRERQAAIALQKSNAGKPELMEPAWEIVNSKPANSPLKSAGSSTLKPAATKTKASSPTLTIVQAAPSTQVGIARTVSVSRPAKMVTTVKPSVHSPERLVVRKPLTPTLVELKNRKSQRVQIVDS